MTLTDNEMRAVCRAIDEERVRDVRATCADEDSWWDRHSVYVIIGGWFAIVAVLDSVREITALIGGM